MPDRHVYAGYLARALLDHYARVVSTFTGRLLLPGHHLESITGHAAALRQTATRQAFLIMDTLDRDIASAHHLAMAAKSFDRGLQTKKSKWSAVMTIALRKVKAAVKSRLPTISNVNTNGIAETARSEAAGTGSNALIYKRWVTKADEKVRASHVAMHGMMERVEVPFVVGGHQMMQPGDMTYNPPLSEVINCRCWLEYFQRSDDGTVPEEDGTYDQLDMRTQSSPTRPSRRPGAPLGSNIPKNPTSVITFTGKPTRARIILGNGETATATVGNGSFTVRVGRKVIAETSLIRQADGTYRLPAGITVDAAYRLTGVDTLIRNSVNATNNRVRQKP